MNLTNTNPFTVISFDDESGQLYSDHVFASSSAYAQTLVAIQRTDVNFVAIIPGHLKEGEDIDYAGESIVHASDILGQPDVYAQPGEIGQMEAL